MPSLGDPLGALVWLLVAGLATTRGTHLIVSDKIAEPIRLWAWRLDPSMRHVGYLVSCPYCTGIWVAIWACLSIAAAQAFGWVLALPVLVLAVAQVGILLRGSDSEDDAVQSAPWPEDHR